MHLEHGDLTWDVRALVDTGAPFTVFDRGTGDALGIEFGRMGARRTWHKIAGGEYAAQAEMVVLKLSPFHDLWWESEVDFFIDDWGMPFAGLLGQEGFLDRWVVSYNYYESYFIVEEPDSFRIRLSVDPTEEYEQRDTGWKGPV